MNDCGHEVCFKGSEFDPHPTCKYEKRTEAEIVLELRTLEKRLNEVAQEACNDAKLEVEMDSYVIHTMNQVRQSEFRLRITKPL